VLDTIYESGRGNPPLPDIDLGYAGLADHQLEFLTGVYVAAFDRAPDAEGLQYWAAQLANNLNAGLSEPDAYKAVTRDIYWSGEQNGEAGTGIANTADYVTFVYNTVLGRTPDQAGLAHWVQGLDDGTLARNEFLTVFLTSALNATDDGAYVSARIAVAEYAAQAHLSGSAAPPLDLGGVLQGVHNSATAKAAIDHIESGDFAMSALHAAAATFSRAHSPAETADAAYADPLALLDAAPQPAGDFAVQVGHVAGTLELIGMPAADPDTDFFA